MTNHYFKVVLSFLLANTILTSSVVFSSPHNDITLGQAFLSKLDEKFSLPRSSFPLEDYGLNRFLDYKKYGRFVHLNTSQYDYLVLDAEKLKSDIGFGIYPNQRAYILSKRFNMLKKSEIFNKGTFLDFYNKKDYEKAFYKILSDDTADYRKKTILTAFVLESAGHILPALKAFYAAMVHFPQTKFYFSKESFCYIGEIAISNIRRLCREYPALDCAYIDSLFLVRDDDKVHADKKSIFINPGFFEKASIRNKKYPKEEVLNFIKKGNIGLTQFESGQWEVSLNKKPFFIHGAYYNPSSDTTCFFDNASFQNFWMFQDSNGNGLMDAPFESWIDANRNGAKDITEKSLGDFQLLTDMGVNTIVVYPSNNPVDQYDSNMFNKKLFREAYDKFKIKVIIGDYLGAYGIGSGAVFEEGTDYLNAKQKRLMLSEIEQKVKNLKDEPYVLMWMIGAGNNDKNNDLKENPTLTNASDYPKEYAKFIQEVITRIRDIDDTHPIIVVNNDTNNLLTLMKYAPDIDILGINSYRGNDGFLNLWQEVFMNTKKPVLITHYGFYPSPRSSDPEYEKMNFYKKAFKEVVFNQAGSSFFGNSIGSILGDISVCKKRQDQSKDDFPNTVQRILNKSYYYFRNLYQSVNE